MTLPYRFGSAYSGSAKNFNTQLQANFDALIGGTSSFTTVDIAPPAMTATQGLTINMTGLAPYAPATQFALDNTAWNYAVIGDYSDQFAYGVNVLMGLNGTAWARTPFIQKTALGASIFINGTPIEANNQVVALAGAASVNVPSNGSDVFGANISSICGAAGTARTLIGCELDLGNSGTVTSGIVGVQVAISGANSSGTDVCYVVSGGAVAWDFGYYFHSSVIKSTGTAMGSGANTISCANGVDFTNFTFSGSAFKGGGWSVDGNGNMHLNMTNLINAVNDGAAAGAGASVGQVYRNGSVLMVRVA